MRNLKRALSLGLAAVMVMGMMIVGTSAKSYTDSDKIENQVAVEVLGEIGAMVGNEDGSFAPDRVVTRAEMAVLLTRILYGNDLNVDQFKGLNTFTDVPDWAEGFVNLCASLGIVAGRGDGIFDPNATVTTAEASLMLSRALGYFKNPAEFGSDWALAAVKRATQANIIGGDMVLQANAGLTRDDVAQMTFNTLTKAVPVQYNELLNVYYNENKGITYALTFYYTDTLGYKNFDLVYRTGDKGDYGRPSTTWGIGSYRASTNTPSGNDTYGLNEDGSLKPESVKMTSDDEIITVAETPDLVYTAGTKENVIYKAVGKSVVDGYTWTAYVDGAEQADPAIPANDRDATYDYTNKGAVTEIYMDDVNDKVTVVKIDYYMGEITDIREDDNGEYATVRMLSNDSETSPIDERDIYCQGFAEDDYVVFTVDEDDNGDSFVASIAAPETAEGTVTRVSKDSDPEGNQGSYVKLDDGNEYSYSDYTASDLDNMNEKHPTLDVEYRLYLDPNGYVIGFAALDDYNDNYLYVEESDSYLGTIEAKVVFTDGTEKVVTVDDEYIDTNSNRATTVASALKGNVYAWTESDGVYTLRQILTYNTTRPTTNHYKDTQDQAVSDSTNSYEIENGVAYIKINGTLYIVDEDTAFIDTDEQILYTGYENVPDYVNSTGAEKVMFWAIDSNGDQVLDSVFIYSGEASNDNKTYFYVADESDFETYDKNKMYKEHNLYIDSEKTTLIFTQSAHDQITGKGLYCVERTNGDGVVTDISAVTAYKTPQVVGTRSFALSADKADQWVTNDDTIFVVATYDLKTNGTEYQTPVITKGDLRDMEADEDYTTQAIVVKPNKSDEPAELVYIVKYEIQTFDNTITFVAGDDANYTVTDVKGTAIAGNKLGVNDNQNAQFKIAYDANLYVLNSVKVGDVELEADANGVYTIKNVTKDMTVTVNLSEKSDTFISFYTSQYALNTTEIYVNGTKLDNSTLTESGVGMRSFPVKAGDTVIMTNSAFSTSGEVYVDADHTVTGTVNGDARSLTFTVSGSMTMRAPATIAADVVPSTTPAINADLTLKLADGTVINGGTVTKAELNGSDKLEISVTLPEGYTASAATVNYVANSTSTNIAMTGGSTSNGVYTDTSSAAADTVIGDGSGVLKIEMTVTAPTTAKVSYSGAVVVTDASDTNTLTKLNLKGQGAAALKFKLDASEIPTYAKETKITYKLTGTTNDGEYTVTTATPGVVLGNEAGGPGNIEATGPVTVEIVKVECSKVAYDLVVNDSKYTKGTNTDVVTSGDATVGTEESLDNFAIKAASGTIQENATAKITFTVDNAGVDGQTFTTTAAVAADSNNEYVVKATDVVASTGLKITADGKGAVTITVTKVEVEKVMAKITTAISNGSGDELQVTGLSASATAVALESDGRLKVEVTLAGSGGSGVAADGSYIVTDGNGNQVGTLKIASSAGNTATFYIDAPSDLVEYNFTAVKI